MHNSHGIDGAHHKRRRFIHHISFDNIGLPAFQFIQDPIEYFSRTHHSSADVYDRIVPDDLKQASTVMAAFLYQAAQMDERFPRKPMGQTNR